MAYLTLPPAVEVRESFKRSENRSALAFAAWFQAATVDLTGSWKNEVFAKLAKFERGPDVPGFGSFRLSEEAAGQLRLQLAAVSLQSLPFPSLAPLSDRGAQLDWRTGDRSVEVTAFADGELVIEAVEGGRPVNLDASARLESYLEWLVGAADRQLVYAAAR
jgi:hypothetical protein